MRTRMDVCVMPAHDANAHIYNVDITSVTRQTEWWHRLYLYLILKKESMFITTAQVNQIILM